MDPQIALLTCFHVYLEFFSPEIGIDGFQSLSQEKQLIRVLSRGYDQIKSLGIIVRR